MKQRTRFMVVILCVTLLLSFSACGDSDDAPAVSAEEKALLRYQQACDNLAAAPDLTIEAEYSLSRTVGGEVYSEKFTETAAYRGLGTADAMASVVQQIAFGPYQTQYTQTYYQGSAYCQTDDSTFCADMTIQQFVDRQIPAVLVDAGLYDQVEVNKMFGTTVITFSAPTALESWATDYTGAVLVSAVGAVTLDDDGLLQESTYTAQYTCGTIVYDLQVTAMVKPEAALWTFDEASSESPVLSCFDAPRKILQVVGDVYTAAAMSARYTESVSSEAFARSRSQTSLFDIYGVDDQFMARSSYEVINTDYSNTPVTTAETVIYQNGICTSSLNGAEPTVREGISAETMRTYCEDAVLAALFTPNHIKNAKLTEKENQLRIDFAGNAAFADYVCSNIYAIFNANLDTYAQSYTTPKASGYLCIDKTTGLPTALGITLERIHVAGEVSYSLTYQLDQTMQLSSTQAYENITGQQEPIPTEP